jgi:hypothetical protein
MKAYFKFNPEVTDLLAQTGFTNPANVIWELVPFSFVVDWFIRIGDYLNACTKLDNLTVTSVSRTVSITESEFCTAEVVDGTPVGTATNRRWSFSYYQHARVSSYTYREIIPLPELPLPVFRNPISKGHLAIALSLITQLTGK